jgi:CRISPR-associated protein (TIGR03986 family)
MKLEAKMAPVHSNPTGPREDKRGNIVWAFAPYNFIPLPEKMVSARTPLDQDVYHDKKEALTGWIDCELETCSPTYVRGLMTEETYKEISQNSDELTPEQKKKIAPFYSTEEEKIEGLPRPAIPGSTLRGMIRALVEIVGYGRMRWVGKEPTFSFRAVAASRHDPDPLRKPYREIIGENGINVRAGYLTRESDRWFVRPAKIPKEEDNNWPDDAAYLKVSETPIKNGMPSFIGLNSPDYQPQWHKVSFDAEVKIKDEEEYVAITRIGPLEAQYTHKGTLICSGNMLETETSTDRTARKVSPRKKHVVILETKNEPEERLEIPHQVVLDYRAGLTTFQKEKLSNYWEGNEWGCLKDGAPVFYVAEGDIVQYFGHSPNFRVPAQLIGLDRAANPSDFVPEELRNGEKPDLADSIFGWVEEKSKIRGPSLFQVEDLKNPAKLATKLKDPQDTVSRYLHEQFSTDTIELLNDYNGSSSPSKSLRETLVHELNRLLQGPSLYDKERFKEVKLTDATSKLIEQNPQGLDLIRLNRSLLEDTYPHEIAKNQKNCGGRVFFSDASFVNAKDGVWYKTNPIIPHILSGPKPTTFQHYLVQDRSLNHDPDKKSSLAHYGTSPMETQIRGHKLYWHKGTNPDIEASEVERTHEKQLTRIIPLKPGVQFKFRIYFENLRREELGALLWVLNLPGGPNKTYRHKLGMGKPLGMGAVAITPHLFLTDRLARYRTLFSRDGWEEASKPEEAEQHILLGAKNRLHFFGF